MIAGLFGLGGPEMIVLVLLGGSCSVAVAVGVIVLVVTQTRDKKSRLPDDDD
jgi:hypothetical protein